ncbi:MAG: IS66 family transposase zinc-finger binding domain-containing protein [Oscillospiraceae bacterium]|nr:IS66 family transposase zinc-finger binding domain-containing protein [Oscillospiraceae bacterium]
MPRFDKNGEVTCIGEEFVRSELNIIPAQVYVIDIYCKVYKCTHCADDELTMLMDRNEVVPKTKMALREIMTILIMYHLSRYRTFKWYYINHVMKYQKQDFPTLVSYNRFVEIMQYALVPLL